MEGHQEDKRRGKTKWRLERRPRGGSARPEFAREFLLGAIDQGVKLQAALGTVIRAMGVKEFAAKVRMASPSVLRAISTRTTRRRRRSTDS